MMCLDFLNNFSGYLKRKRKFPFHCAVSIMLQKAKKFSGYKARMKEYRDADKNFLVDITLSCFINDLNEKVTLLVFTQLVSVNAGTLVT
jgi:hypothetical protein